MARHAARITFDRTEFLVTACAVETRRLKTHRVDIGLRGPKTSRLVFNRPYQLCPVVLAAKLLLDPEELDEQHRRPDFADDAADDRTLVAQRDGEAAIFLLPHLFGVIADQPAEHRALGRSNRALDGNRRHRISSSPRSPTTPRARH